MQRLFLSLAFLVTLSPVFAPAVVAQERQPGLEIASESPFVPQDPRLQPYLEISFRPELNTQVPMDLVFMGDDGQRKPLSQRVTGTRPILLAVVYYRCPTMCNLMLNGMIDSLKEIHYEPGKDFEVVAVSFDSRETHVVAAAKKAGSLEYFGENSHPEAWSFLVGDQPTVDKLTQALKFGYKYDAAIDQFAHGSGLLVLTPDGRISRFLPGTLYPTRDLQLSIVEASEGKVGKLSDRLALLCFHYDPQTGKYGPMIDTTLKVACIGTAAALGLLIWNLFRRERKARVLPPLSDAP